MVGAVVALIFSPIEWFVNSILHVELPAQPEAENSTVNSHTIHHMFMYSFAMYESLVKNNKLVTWNEKLPFWLSEKYEDIPEIICLQKSYLFIKLVRQIYV